MVNYTMGILCFFFFSSVISQKVAKSTGPPSFFLQDPNDGNCLAGENYKRCALDTLWYVTGKPGSYQIHKRPVNLDSDEDGVCLARDQCHADNSDVKLHSCDHCGAKKWNILGDAESGYVLTEDSNKNCLKRVGDKVTTIKCDKGYTGVSLQFASKDDLTAMSSDGARLITSAADNDMNGVKAFLKNKVDVNSRDWDKLTPLIAAAGKGHLGMVKLLVSNKADVNLRDKDNITAVMEASMGGHKPVVEYLVSAGATIDVFATSGVSPLWLAASEGHIDVVKYLLAKKADPNNKRVDGITALMAASTGGHTEVVRLLVSAGALVNVKDKDGLTPLISAAENGSLPLVKLLIDNKAEVNVLSDTGFSPLIISAAHGHVNVVNALLEAGADLELDHPEKVTALMYAAAGGFADVVATLLLKGAQVNLIHSQGGSAIMEAATAGNVTVIDLLLKAGSDPHIIDNDGVTCLMSAASQGHTAAAKLFLDLGLDVNAVANSGGTSLMFAAGGGHNETTKLLIENKADVNKVVFATAAYIEQVAKAIAEGKEDVEPHKDGVTALMVAAQGGHIGTVKLLVDAGAKVDIADDEGMTSLLNAIKGNFGEVAKFLVEHEANPNDVFVDEKGLRHNLLMDSIIVSNSEFALTLISKGANVSYTDSDGVTVLTQAAYHGLDTVVEGLLQKGADLLSSSVEGINPLIAAASEGHKDIVRRLLATGKANINAKDKDGTNALMAAAVRGHKEVVELLVANGIDVNLQNADGHSALMFAYNGKNQVQTLLDKYSEYMKEANDNSTKIIKDALQTHLDVVTLLIKYGADVNLKDNEGHVAADFDYKAPEIILPSVDSPVLGATNGFKEL